MVGLLQSSVFRLLREHQFDVAFIRFRRRVDQCENAFRSRESHHDVVELLGKPGDGAGDLTGVQQERCNGTDSLCPVDAEIGADTRHQRISDIREVRVDRHHDVSVTAGLDVGVLQLQDDFLKFLLCDVLMEESLYDLLSGEDLFDIPVEVREVRLQVFEIMPAVSAEEVGHIHDDRQHEQVDNGQTPVKDEHHDDDARHLHDGIDDLRESIRYQHTHRIHVAGEAGHDLAMSLGIVILHGQRLQLHEQIMPHVCKDTRSYLAHDHAVQITGEDRRYINERHHAKHERELREVHVLLADERYDVVVDDRLEEIAGRHVGKRGHDDRQHDDDKMHLERGHEAEQPPDGSLDVFRPRSALRTIITFCHYAFTPCI